MLSKIRASVFAMSLILPSAALAQTSPVTIGNGGATGTASNESTLGGSTGAAAKTGVGPSVRVTTPTNAASGSTSVQTGTGSATPTGSSEGTVNGSGSTTTN